VPDGAVLDGDRVAVAFGRVARANGLAVPVDAVVNLARAWAAVGPERPERVYWAGRATLVRRPEDVTAYDAAFAAWFGGLAAPDPTAPAVVAVPVVVDDSDPGEGAAPPDDAGGPTTVVRWSATEVLRHKDLAACTPAEREEALALFDRVRAHQPPRPARRTRPDRRTTGRPDLARTTRSALRLGGEPVRLVGRRPATRPRPVVLLVDVSGSMAPYARALLRFAQVLVAGGGRVEAFALGTRLTRLTRRLAGRDPDEALRAATAEVDDWEGGTRLGPCLRRFNDDWGVRGLARGAVVLVLSDGWDRGDPEVLGEEVTRLHRVTHRLVWVNPLKAGPGYEPLARGMAAALPHVDEFVEGHSVASLEDLLEVLG